MDIDAASSKHISDTTEKLVNAKLVVSQTDKTSSSLLGTIFEARAIDLKLSLLKKPNSAVKNITQTKVHDFEQQGSDS